MAIQFFSVNGAGSGGGGGTVTTANGISGNGTIGTPIILGGTFTGNTTLLQAGFTFNIQDVTNGTASAFTATFGDFGVGFIVCQFIINSSTIQLFYQSGVSTKTISIDNTPGIVISDVLDNVGLIGQSVFPISSPNQYLQAGNVGTANVAAQDTAGQTTTQIIPPAYTPAADAILRINAYAFYRSGAGSVAITVAYTDITGNPQSEAIGSVVNAANVVSHASALIIKVKGGTAVQVTNTVTGSIIYDAGATIENLFT